jgi:hypothetical protein
MSYYRIPINKGVVYLTSEEINYLLMKDIELYKAVLRRSKGIIRNESLNARIEEKRNQF